MGKSSSKQPKAPSGRTNLASCIVATIFLIFITIIILILYFTMLKPKHPKLTVKAIQLPSFSLSNNSATFVFSQYATVDNPNHGVFTHFHSSLQLLYGPNQIGFMFIPAGKISAGKTEYMAATFSVKSFPLAFSSPAGLTNGVDALEIESRIELAGRVRVLHFFTHYVEARAYCRVAISVSDGSVIGFHC